MLTWCLDSCGVVCKELKVMSKSGTWDSAGLEQEVASGEAVVCSTDEG